MKPDALSNTTLDLHNNAAPSDDIAPITETPLDRLLLAALPHRLHIGLVLVSRLRVAPAEALGLTWDGVDSDGLVLRLPDREVGFCEAMGLDVQFHACGPAHRAVMAATRNTHFYEMALVGPGMPAWSVAFLPVAVSSDAIVGCVASSRRSVDPFASCASSRGTSPGVSRSPSAMSAPPRLRNFI